MLRTRSAASPRPATTTTTRRAVAASTLALLAASSVAAVAPSHAAPAAAPSTVAAPANPARAFTAASSVVALQAASLKVVKAQQDQAKTAKAALASARGAQQASRSQARVSGSPRAIGRSLAAGKGWGGSQFACLDKLWTKESNWQVTADNPTSSAYGIPQALPGHRMKSHGAKWRTDAATQIRWGLDYIDDRYGSPCKAWAHSRAVNWY